MEGCHIYASSGRPLTIRERREKFWIKKLERLPCFEQMVKKLVVASFSGHQGFGRAG
jgi:hypothetical protein